MGVVIVKVVRLCKNWPLSKVERWGNDTVLFMGGLVIFTDVPDESLSETHRYLCENLETLALI